MDARFAIADAIARWRRAYARPLVLAIDGHGAAGKTTIARAAAESTGAALVHLDDFFLGGPAAAIDRGDPTAVIDPGCIDPGCIDPGRIDPDRGVEQYYDAERLRTEALGPLRSGQAAAFAGRAFRPDGWDLRPTLVRVEPRDVVVLEGVSSAGPHLAHDVDVRVLVETPEPERVARLHSRIGPEEWDETWLAAERVYFTRIAPREAFDLVVSGSATAGPDVRAVAGPC